MSSFEEKYCICRCCLQQENRTDDVTTEKMFDIFESEINEKLIQLCHIDVRIDDLLPHLICLKCKELVEKFDTFNRLCNNSDQKLRALYRRHDNHETEANNKSNCNFTANHSPVLNRRLSSSSTSYCNTSSLYDDNCTDMSVLMDDANLSPNDLEEENIFYDTSENSTFKDCASKNIEAKEAKDSDAGNGDFKCKLCTKSFPTCLTIVDHIESDHMKFENVNEQTLKNYDITYDIASANDNEFVNDHFDVVIPKEPNLAENLPDLSNAAPSNRSPCRSPNGQPVYIGDRQNADELQPLSIEASLNFDDQNQHIDSDSMFIKSVSKISQSSLELNCKTSQSDELTDFCNDFNIFPNAEQVSIQTLEFVQCDESLNNDNNMQINNSNIDVVFDDAKSQNNKNSRVEPNQVESGEISVSHHIADEEESDLNYTPDLDPSSQSNEEATSAAVIIDDLALQCRVCKLKLSSIAECHKHIKKSHPFITKIYSCKFCEKTFKSASNRNQHERLHRETTDYHCLDCDKDFKTASQYINHRKTHAFRYECRECDKVYVYGQSLKHHYKNVHPESYEQMLSSCTKRGDYECEICSKIYENRLSYLAHKRFDHNWAKIFTCPESLCKKKFFNKEQCELHYKKKHSREKLLECEYCNKTFLMKCHLLVHVKKHRNEKNFKCDICGKCFIQKIHLKTHLSKHTGMKEYICDQESCNKAFTSSTYLKKHKFMAHSEGLKKYNCDVCGEGFPMPFILNKHKRNHKTKTN